jgi:hypothetical protein
MENNRTWEFLDLLGARTTADVDLDPSTLNELVSVTCMLQRVVQEDRIYFRAINRVGLAVVLEKKFLSDKFVRVSRELAEIELRINFNASHPEYILVPEETIH